MSGDKLRMSEILGPSNVVSESRVTSLNFDRLACLKIVILTYLGQQWGAALFQAAEKRAASHFPF